MELLVQVLNLNLGLGNYAKEGTKFFIPTFVGTDQAGIQVGFLFWIWSLIRRS